MAIFESSSQTKVRIDDTEKLECALENAQNINNHTEYILRVQRGPNKENKWTVSRRYRDFAALNVSLQHANIDLPIPPKKLIGNMQPSFVAERQIALQNYINEVLKHQVLVLSLPVRSFLDPNNYPLTIAEQALQTMSIALRGDGHYELKAALPDIGWRIRKHYFLHPYIDEILSIQTLESGAYVVRRIHVNGSVRDLLYGTDYNKQYLAKYGNPKVRKPFTNGQLSHYGYQVLQALKFLHDKGLAHGHLHPGNIAIENQRAVLMDIENFLTGVPCLHRPYMLELKRTSTVEAIDVYCFGRTLYEMAFAEPLSSYYCDMYPDGIAPDLESVLRLCLSSTSCKHGGPSIEQLLTHPFFTQATMNGLGPRLDMRIHLKFPLTLKDQLRACASVTEDRLRRDQKMVRSAKKEVRIQEILNSEQEMKKQRKRAKKRDSVWKSSSSLAEIRSQSASTASSPTPPTPPLSGETSANSSCLAGSSPADARGALLNAICSFDRTRLARIDAR
ncbi:jg10298 [Pararge aegeria aegeria]|uniref:Jg10298 protein n=1 Tax=Pararge aegeria aegeria TaxID=348720 RepID=A0A8S4SA01_9NEOP|nr:jg10298 [Pararge aegeria aegeria]